MIVNLKYDTKSKEYSVTVDGTPLANVTSFSLYCMDEMSDGGSDGGADAEKKPCGSINIGISGPEMGGMRTYTHMSAKDDTIILHPKDSQTESIQDYARKVLRVKK